MDLIKSFFNIPEIKYVIKIVLLTIIIRFTFFAINKIIDKIKNKKDKKK